MAPSWMLLLPPAPEGQGEEALMSPALEGRTPTCPLFGAHRTLLLLYHSIIPCTWAAGWDSSLGLCQHCLGVGQGCCAMAPRQLWSSTSHCGGWESAGTSRSSALSHWGRGTQMCERGGGKEGISSKASWSLSLPLHLPLPP